MENQASSTWGDAYHSVRELIKFLGEDPDREGLKETPYRVLKSLKEMLCGYSQDPKDVMKTFEDGACDEMVLVKGINLESLCEHHLLPFIGQAHVAYIPNKRVIGLSKIARLVDIYAKRLQIQERLTVQITKALDDYLKPQGSACVIEAKHLCLSCRGVMKQNAVMVTSSLTGAFRDPEVRSEFLRLIGRE
jgi:GTP cyclohydrolase I